MTRQSIALISGANKGIGLQIAKDLHQEGFVVLIGSRDIDKGEAAAAEVGANAHTIQLDVTDAASIAAAAERIETKFGYLDILVNNAGISNTLPAGTPFEKALEGNSISVASMADVRQIFETNVFGVIALTQAMLPLLKAARSGRIVNVSSGAGSLTSFSNPDNPNRLKFGVYSASKTALNAVTLGLSIDLEEAGIAVNSVCPGFTSTDLNNFNGTQSVAQGAEQAVKMALLGNSGPTGTFSARSGSLPW